MADMVDFPDGLSVANGLSVDAVNATTLSTTGDVTLGGDIDTSDGTLLVKNGSKDAIRITNNAAGLGGQIAATDATGAAAYEPLQIIAESIALSAPTVVDGSLTTTGDATIGGNLQVGVTGQSTHAIFKAAAAQDENVLLVGGNGRWAATFSATGSDGFNGAGAAIKVGTNSVTGRSINTGGTINALGMDCAEYEPNNGLQIAKGAIVGFKVDGTLTLTFSEAVRFGIKSTNPHLVGGDTWGTEDAVGKRPEQPVYVAPAYEGQQAPQDVPEYVAQEFPAPVLLDAVIIPDEPTAPEEPAQGEDEDATAWYVRASQYALDTAAHLQLVLEREAAIANAVLVEEANASTLTIYEAEKAEFDAAEQALVATNTILVEQYEAALAAYEAAQATHTQAVADAQEAHAEATTQYEEGLAAFNTRLEAARALVDRVAYSGKCPVNVTGAAAGGYIVAANDSGNITGEFVADPDFSEYKRAVGRVNRILEDGRAEVAVMVH